MRNILSVWLALGLGACVGGYDLAHPNVLSNVQRHADWQGFQYCGGWGCSDPHPSLFTPLEWLRVEAIMEPPTAIPAAEREQIAAAIGLMESVIGRKTGYHRDRAGTAAGLFQLGQLDCYSEATNTSTFLHLLHNAGLLRHHTPADPIMRGQATSRSWRQTHATATMVENSSGTLFAMDSWFFDSGHKAVYVEAEIWGDAWAPEDGATF